MNPAIGGIPLVLGGNVFGWTCDRDASFAVLDAFYEAGGRMIDTAEIYSKWIPGNVGGESEALIGEWQEARGIRAELRIATKVAVTGEPAGLTPQALASHLAGSLERLRTDYVDLLYSHYDAPGCPQEETAQGFAALIASGSVRAAGASNFTAERLASALEAADRAGGGHYSVLQNEYNLVRRRKFEGAVQDLCLARGIASMPFFGLAAGYLTGKYRSAADLEKHARGGRVKEFIDIGAPVLTAMDTVAAESGASHPAIALAWLLAQPGVAAPIASATTPAQLGELIAAVSLKLDEHHLERLTAAISA